MAEQIEQQPEQADGAGEGPSKMIALMSMATAFVASGAHCFDTSG
jgi:hypothetical protein